MYKKYIKRFLDFILSLLALIALSPLFLIISIIIKLDSKGPIIFEQKRVGRYNDTFNIYKFRTMRTDAPKDSATDKLDNADQWITKSGKFLRKTSLDELPQLLNIIKGDMSIVGPRPALWNQNNLNNLRTESYLHPFRPGLTGLAQINGRDENDDEEKVYWDRIYCDTFNFTLDIKTMFNTVFSIMKKDGYSEGSNTKKTEIKKN